MARLTLDLLRKVCGKRRARMQSAACRPSPPLVSPGLPLALPPSLLQRCEHQAGAPLAALEEAPLAHAGLEDFEAALAAHARRVCQVHLQGNVVGRLDRGALGKLKVRREKRKERVTGRRAGARRGVLR
jgi:hypothetical protein